MAAAKVTKAKKDEMLEHIRAGMRPGAAAEFLGYTRTRMYALLADDEEFAERVEIAEREATEHVEEALYQAAISGNVTAAKIWLERKEERTGKALVVADPQAQGDPELDRLNNLARGHARS